MVKKISDTKYLVKTPSRHKETQVSHIDMLKAYHEKPKPELVILNNKLGLENPTHSENCVSTFVTPSGLYQYKVMPFGMKNAPATFQRMVNKLVRDIDGCEGYIDDVVIYSDNWSDHIR